MRKIVLILMFLASVAMAEGVHWAKDFNSGMKTAQKEHKPMFFLIASHECSYCNKLEQDTLVDDNVVKELNKNFVSVIAFVDDGDYFPRELQKPGLPTIWFLHPNGEPMFQAIMGYMHTKQFLKALSIVKAEFKKENNKTKSEKK